MNKIWLSVLAVSFMLIIGAVQPVWAHDDGTMHVHIKGRVMSDKGGPIAGVQLDLNSVRGAIYPPSFFVPGSERQGSASTCLSDVVPIINPTNKEGYYEVIAKFKKSYQEAINNLGTTYYNEIPCADPASRATFQSRMFSWRKDGMTEIHPQ
jgi:hypothetical protein